MKTWRPDTCGCEVEEIYSGTNIIGGGKVLKKCPAHLTVLDNELYGVLYANPDGENKRKNHLLRILLGQENVKGLGLEEMKKNEKGEDAGLGLKQGVDYAWSFEGTGKNRKLKVEVKGAMLTKKQKDDIKISSDSKFGLDKIAII